MTNILSSFIFRMISIIVISGLIFAAALKPIPMACTLAFCTVPENSTGLVEITCNTCAVADPILFTGLINISRYYSAKEINIYLDQQYLETRYEKISKNWLGIDSLGILIRYKNLYLNH